MCGICGEFRFDGKVPDLGAIRAMLDMLRHRGPDHEGSYSDGPVALGHRRLSVIDLSSRANQPMVDPQLGLAVVFNGTLYNFRELREELARAGYAFFSSGDTEVLLKAYDAWGEDCVERFSGMFAFAVWDMRRQSLFLARDRVGIKPLYYASLPGGFRFASSPQALLAGGGVDVELDPVALHHHLTLHAVVPAPRTVLRGVRKLEPGHTLTLDAGGAHRTRRYWTLQAMRPETVISDREWVGKIREALVRAVERRLSAADVPVGVLLSGGLDSSLLVGLLAEYGGRTLKTYSVGFEDQPEEPGSEFEYSDPVARKFGTEHHRYRIPNREVLARLPEAIDHMAEPMVAQDAVAFYLLAEQVAQDVKVVQSGQGADEVFGGYFWYPRMASEGGPLLDRFRGHYFDRDQAEFAETVRAPWVSEDFTAALIADLLAEPGSQTFMDAVLRMDVTTLIVDDPVKRVDNMTMAWGLEARVPFLDHELIELAMKMPPELKLQDGGKWPLKQIARGLLPDAVIDRPKGYFPVPALKYVRGEFLDLMRSVLQGRACRERGLIRPQYIRRLLDDPEAYLTPIRGSKLWHLALFELWMQRNVDHRAAV